MGRAAVEANLHRVRVRRAEDDLPDRRGLVVDVADLRSQPRRVERGRAEQADLLLRREQELDSRVRPAIREHAPRRLEHDGHGRLVVRAEDGAAGVADDAVLEHRLERPVRRDGVEMRAEEERHAVRGRLDPRVQVSRVRPDLRAGVVLVHVEGEIAEVGGHAVGDLALLARRAPQRGQLGEERDDF